MLELFSLLLACGGPPAESVPTVEKKEAAVEPESPPVPAQEALEGGPYPGLLVSQAWFWKGSDGKPRPGPARLEILRKSGEEWIRTRLEDGDSNVFHKAMPYDGGILTIGAENASLKKWTFSDGKWTQDLLWTKSWGGKFNRLRDIEIGDVDGDGKDEFVIATHDAGVVAVLHPDEGNRVEELDQKADTFVHEIEIGDVDGDGKLEFFATPTDRNKANQSQGGSMVMYRWDGNAFVRSMVDPFGKTHAKEILAADIDGDGISELFSVVEAETIGKTIVKPVEVRQYSVTADGGFSPSVIATIDDRQMRFLVPGDFDHDGTIELVAAAMKSGLWLLDPGENGWEVTSIDSESSGFEHTSYGADLDGDGKLELYVASDDQGEIRRYLWNASTSSFGRTKVADIPGSTITWNIVSGEF
jgi:hypothetical protein